MLVARQGLMENVGHGCTDRHGSSLHAGSAFACGSIRMSSLARTRVAAAAKAAKGNDLWGVSDSDMAGGPPILDHRLFVAPAAAPAVTSTIPPEPGWRGMAMNYGQAVTSEIRPSAGLPCPCPPSATFLFIFVPSRINPSTRDL